MAPAAFTPDQVDDAIRFMLRSRFTAQHPTVSYTEIFVAAGLPTPQDLYEDGGSPLITQFMESFHFRCIQVGLPPLDSLVVQAGGMYKGYPGKGYFTVNDSVYPFGGRDVVKEIAAQKLLEAQQEAARLWLDGFQKGTRTSPISD